MTASSKEYMRLYMQEYRRGHLRGFWPRHTFWVKAGHCPRCGLELALAAELMRHPNGATCACCKGELRPANATGRVQLEDE